MRFIKELKNLKVYKPGKPIEEVKGSLGLETVYKLASNEIPFPPLYIRKSIQAELENINRYPQGSCHYLRKFLAKKFRINESQIVFGNGSDEIIVLTLRALIEKGDEVIVAYPTFLIYEIQAAISGAKVVRVPLKEFHYDLPELAKKVNRKTKIIFIANPDNPTGTYCNHKEISNFLKLIPKSVLVYFDEAYFEFAPGDFPKTEQFLRMRDNVIFTRTFSKAYALAGLRIGYGITTLKIAAALNKVREPFNINRFAQVAGVCALENKGFLKKVIPYIEREKKYLYGGLSGLGVFFVESAANFILIDLKKDTKSLYNYLLKKGVIVRELRGWGLKNFFRVTIGLHKENKKFIGCLRGYLQKSNKCGRSIAEFRHCPSRLDI